MYSLLYPPTSVKRVDFIDHMESSVVSPLGRPSFNVFGDQKWVSTSSQHQSEVLFFKVTNFEGQGSKASERVIV